MALKKPIHPGVIVLEDCLKALNLSVTRAAEALGVTRQTLSNLINTKSGISPDMAIRLEKMGWSTADTWVRMQAAYDLAQARTHEGSIKVSPIRAAP